MDFLDEFKDLRIQFEEINMATDNFAENKVIGWGGFGKVYKGDIKGRGTGAIKRLDSRLGQGDSEFWKEVMTLSRYKHENLVSLLGYCDKDGEMILVYEYASRGSLDCYLRDATLSWTRRLKICLAAARGLCYLHNPNDTHQRILHRDIKSANILLDENWNAKVSDLGLSRIGPANQPHTVLVTNVVGTPGYVDPLYMEKYRLTKESDVYSFGVVLFEVLCGRLCYKFSSGEWKPLVPEWKQSFQDNNLADIVFQDLMPQMDPASLKTFSDIAYQCLQSSRDKRPKMAEVVKELETALELQEICDEEVDYEDIIKSEVPDLIYTSKLELKMRVSEGILVNGGKTWFSINKNEEHIEMISVEDCMPSLRKRNKLHAKEISRFGDGIYETNMRFNAHVRARFLTPGITYAVNFVFRYFTDKYRRQNKLNLQYKLDGEKEYTNSYIAHVREDGWMMAQLYQFTSHRRSFDVKILFERAARSESNFAEGIELLPVEQVKHDELEDEEVDMPHIYIDWERKLPSDYEDMIRRSKDSLEWTTKKELYFLFRKGFLINNGEEWFSLAKNGKKSYMLSAKAFQAGKDVKWKHLPESRFKEVAYEFPYSLCIKCEINSRVLSSQTTYACYLIYNLTESHPRFEEPMIVSNVNFGKNVFDAGLDDFRRDECWYIHLLHPQIPVIGPKVGQNTHNPMCIPKIKDFPRLRNDGWKEVRVWEFQTGTTAQMISMNFVLYILRSDLKELVVQGIELQPL